MKHPLLRSANARLRHSLMGLALCGLLASVQAQTQNQTQTTDQVVAVLKGVDKVSLYAKAYDNKAQTRLDPKELGFPLAVMEVDGDFLKVKLNGKEVWLDGAEVAINKAVAFNCVKDQQRPVKTASIQGASSGCK